jgi:hypothetical protein
LKEKAVKLSKEKRASLPKSDFLGPGRSFPGNDAEHLRKAIQLAPRSEHAGNISKATEERIVSAAKRRLYHGDGDGSHWSGK